jgi:subtilisin family serine protease
MTDYEDDPRTRRVDPRLPDLISISAGTHTRNDAGLLGFEILALLYRWTEDGGPLVIAAAGNEGKDKRFYPAAFDWVVGVGSLDRDGRRSDFSNFGDWVNVYAHGRDLLNAFPTGTYEYVEPISGALLGTKQDFTGLAQWSGTSFATPIVTGAIAAFMSDNPGSTARQARDALVGNAKPVTDPTLGDLKALGPPFVPQN